MLGAFDHAGFLAADLEAAGERLAAAYGLSAGGEFELPQYGLRGQFLVGTTTLEVIELADPERAAQRLAGESLRLDHLAFQVEDIEAAAARLRVEGISFRAPDGMPLDAPLELAGALHLWTAPSAGAASVQLIER